jgi:polar amino acid transport system substrate-binding protein
MDIVDEIAPTGRLRVALNMGNPVLASSRTAPERPAGVTIDLGRRFAASLGIEAQLIECESARVSGAQIADGTADVAFLAIDPQRAETLHFSAPYVQIEGFYAVRADSPMRSNDDVDQADVQVVIGKGSAYGLFLQRELQRARTVEVPTSEEVVDTLVANPGFQVAAGVRQQLLEDVKRHPTLRLLPAPFMAIRQAMAMARARSPAARQRLDAFIDEQRASGFIAQALARHGIEGATVLG